MPTRNPPYEIVKNESGNKKADPLVNIKDQKNAFSKVQTAKIVKTAIIKPDIKKNLEKPK